MTAIQAVVLFLIGGASGFMAGLLGIGGAIVLIPMLMYLTPLFGMTFTFHAITGLSMTQVFFASLTGAITHFKGGNLKKELIIYVGGAMLVAGFFGSIASKYLPEKTLTAVFAFVLAIAIIMLFRTKENGNDFKENDAEITYLVSSKDKGIGIALGSAAGILSGMAGVGGAAMLIPSLAYLLNIPLKVCIGTSLGLILAGGTAGFIGKVITGQVPYLPALFVVTGAIVAARLGSKVSIGMSGEKLKNILAMVLILTLVRIIITIFI